MATYVLYSIQVNNGEVLACFIDIHDNDVSTNKLIINIKEIPNYLDSREYKLIGADALASDDWIDECDCPIVINRGINQEILENKLTYVKPSKRKHRVVITDYTGVLKECKETDLIDLYANRGFSNLELKVLPNKGVSVSRIRENCACVIYSEDGSDQIYAFAFKDKLSRRAVSDNNYKNQLEFNEISKTFLLNHDCDKIDLAKEISGYEQLPIIEIHVGRCLGGKNFAKIKEFICASSLDYNITLKIVSIDDSLLDIDKMTIKSAFTFDLSESNIDINELLLSIGEDGVEIRDFRPRRINKIGFIGDIEYARVTCIDSFENIQSLVKLSNVAMNFKGCFINSDIEVFGNACSFTAENSFNHCNIKGKLHIENIMQIDKSFNSSYIDVYSTESEPMTLSNIKNINNSFNELRGFSFNKFNNLEEIRDSFRRLRVESLEIVQSKSYNSFDSMEVENDLRLINVYAFDSFNGTKLKNNKTIEISKINLSNCVNNMSSLEVIKFVPMKDVTAYSYTRNSFNGCPNLCEIKRPENDKLAILRLTGSLQGCKIDSFDLKERDCLSGVCFNSGLIVNIVSGVIQEDNIRGLDTPNCKVLGAKKIKINGLAYDKFDLNKLDHTNIEILGDRTFYYYCGEVIDLWNWDKVTEIESRVFQNCNSKIIILPKYLKGLGEECFADCKQTKHIVFPASLEVINKNAFGDLFKQCIKTNTFTLPIMHVFRDSEAERYFRARRIPVVYIDDIEETFRCIFNKNNIASLLLSDDERYSVYARGEYKDSLDMLFKIDNLIETPNEKESEYLKFKHPYSYKLSDYPEIKKWLSIAIEDCNRRSLGGIHKYNKDKFNIAYAVIFKNTMPLQLSRGIFDRFLNEFETIKSTCYYMDNQEDYYIYVGVCLWSRVNNQRFNFVAVIIKGEIIYATITDNCDNTELTSKEMKRQGLYNFWNYIYERYTWDNQPEYHQKSVFELLNVGDTVIKSNNSNIRFKQVPDLYSDKVLNMLKSELIPLLIEPSRGDTFTGHFISSVNYKYVKCTIGKLGDLHDNFNYMLHIKYMIINEIESKVPDRVFNTLKEISLDRKVASVRNFLFGRLHILENEDQIFLSEREIRLADDLDALNIKRASDLNDIEVLKRILEIECFRKQKTIPKKLELDGRDDGTVTFLNVNGCRLVEIDRSRYCSIEDGSSSYYIYLNNRGDREFYISEFTVGDIIRMLRDLEIVDSEYIRDEDNMGVLTGKQYFVQNLSYYFGMVQKIRLDNRILFVGLHRKSKQAYMLVSDYTYNYSGVIELLRFKSYSDALRWAEVFRNAVDKGLANSTTLILKLKELQKYIISGYSNNVIISDSLRDLWLDLPKQRPIQG